MAALTQELFNAGQGQAVVSVTFDDTDGAISQLSWTVQSGTLSVLIQRPGRPDVTRTATQDGSVGIPAGYNLTQDRGGGWSWRGGLAYSFSWSPPPVQAQSQPKA